MTQLQNGFCSRIKKVHLDHMKHVLLIFLLEICPHINSKQIVNGSIKNIVFLIHRQSLFIRLAL